jgi:ribose transport system ATP-binding protein
MSEFLEMRGIVKRFPGVLALDHVNLSVRKGEVHALLGENGAGKSTLMKILSGAYSKDEGEILFEGKPVEIHSAQDAQRLNISTIYQELNLTEQLTVAENIFMGRQLMKNKFMVDWRRMYDEAQKLLDELGVQVDAHQLIRDLGVAQKDLIDALLKEHVKVNDGTIFGKEGDGFIRLNIGCPRAQLEAALTAMAKVMG